MVLLRNVGLVWHTNNLHVQSVYCGDYQTESVCIPVHYKVFITVPATGSRLTERSRQLQQRKRAGKLRITIATHQRTYQRPFLGGCRTKRAQ